MSDLTFELPPIYKRNGKDCFLDPIRKKLIYITPEETVRQKVVYYLINTLNVPAESISVEQHLSHYGLKSNKRADIVIHKMKEDGEIQPLAVIECKAEEVYLDERAQNQLLDYCRLLNAEYAMMTNGVVRSCYKYSQENDNYILIENFPEYNDMLQGEYVEWDLGELPPRIPFEKLEDFLTTEFASYEDDEYGWDISKLTPIKQAVPVFNLYEGLLDTRVKMPVGDYGTFKLIEDYGVRMISYGNAGGGMFYGPYRSFLVEVNGNIEFYSINVTTYSKSSNPEEVKTCICVAHDDEKESHHALQLVVEDNVHVIGDEVSFFHHGRIAVGNKGSGKISGLRDLVGEMEPKLLRENKFYLGSIKNDRLWRLNDPEVVNLISNLISYAMIRDEYRKMLKSCK